VFDNVPSAPRRHPIFFFNTETTPKPHLHFGVDYDTLVVALWYLNFIQAESIMLKAGKYEQLARLVTEKEWEKK